MVDVFLSKTARLLHKRVGAVETVKQQCDVINALNTSQVCFYALIEPRALDLGSGYLCEESNYKKYDRI